MLAFTAAQADPAQIQTPYRAHGINSRWTLIIDNGRMTLERPGTRALAVEAPAPELTGDGVRLHDRQLSVEIMRLACTVPATEIRYSDTVYITAGRRELTGCGGEALAADSLADTSWHFAEIDGEVVELTGDLLRDDRYAIDFAADMFVGYGGCNRFSARYSRIDDVLTAQEPWGMTRRACAEPVMGRERRLMEILASPVRVSFPDRSTLLLTGEGGTIRLVRTELDGESD